ncbi:MAG: AAA family ATPase [Firmicutes bacterium]|nr:AAA family ATPase [Bacillota bacterium]
MGKVILSCSGSGGTGKTTFAVNLSIVAALRGLKVLIVDMNI